MKKTSWFPRDIRPVRRGFYECRHLGFYETVTHYYNYISNCWYHNDILHHVGAPMRNDKYASPFEWRGLTEEVK